MLEVAERVKVICLAKQQHIKLTLRVTRELNERINKWSYKSGMTKSALIRSAIQHCLHIRGL